MVVMEDFKHWALIEETYWRQKSREIWLKEGDRNAGFFHRMENSRKRRNRLSQLRINGAWAIEQGTLDQDIVRAFKNLLSDPGDWKANHEGLPLSRISELDAINLEQSVSEEEVFSALCEMNGDKAPGLDEFTITFWQFCWETVKADITRMFRDFHETGKFVRSLNTTFIVMISKKGGAVDFKDFRPISFVGSLYKLLAKVLANRLKRVMGKLVNKAQNTFFGGRQIQDGPLIANEIIDSALKKKEKGVFV